MSVSYIPSKLSKLFKASSVLTETNPCLKINYQPLDVLKSRDKNPRTHSAKHIRQIAESIQKFGFTNPVLVDDGNIVIAGHGRKAAAKLLGMAEVPTICLSDLSEAEKRAYVIADNRIAENAGWDKDLLALEFQYLAELDLDFDLTITGFDPAEIDSLLIEPVNDEPDPADDIPPLDLENEPVTQHGDTWLLDNHRVYCGDATEPNSYVHLMGNDCAPLVFTDPPYNVPVNGHVSGLGKTTHGEFVMASGEMSQEQFTCFLRQFIKHLISYSTAGSIHYICMDWRHLTELLSAAQLYDEFKNLCVWVKDNGGMGSLYRSQHELVLVFKNGTAPHINNVQLGKYGRYRTNVWEYPGANSFHASRANDLAMHPTVKPIAMVKDAILDCSNRGDIILDPFGGSGTTLIAAEQCRRLGYLMELDPRYVDVILQRYQTLTGVEPVHENSGLVLSEMSQLRQACADDAVAVAATAPLVGESVIDEMEGCNNE